MSGRFEARLDVLRQTYKMRPGDDDVPALGLLTVAEGLAEVIDLLKGFADAIERAEELDREQGALVKVPTYLPQCTATVTPARGTGDHVIRCARISGHYQEHVNGDVTW